MSKVARRRVVKDLQRLEAEGRPGVCVAPFPHNMMLMHAIIQGPTDSEWEGGIFHLLIRFPSDYPLKPPNVRFLSKMFHPNIYPDGRICLDILHRQWSTGYDLSAVLTSIQSLLSDPNESSPARMEASILYQENRNEYIRRVLKSVEESWSIPNLPDEWVDE